MEALMLNKHHKSLETRFYDKKYCYNVLPYLLFYMFTGALIQGLHACWIQISHMKKEIDAIRAKDISQGGLTQGQQTQIARNEQRITQVKIYSPELVLLFILFLLYAMLTIFSTRI